MMKKKINSVPLVRAMSKLGLASRKEAQELIQSKKVKVDGKVITDIDFPVVPEKIRIEIDGVVQDKVSKRYLMLFKPKGLVTTFQDEKGRKTIYSCLPELNQHMPAVGRLDMHTTGLLILTNDNRFSSWLTDPKNQVPRKYIVTVRGEVSEDSAQKMVEGIIDEGEELKAKSIKIIKSSGKESQLLVELIEGKNREIRRLMLAFKHEVTSLKRISFGNLELGELTDSESRDLTADELQKAFPHYPYSIG